MIRLLLGDALIAVGEKIRGGLPNVDHGHLAGAWESDGPLLTQPQLVGGPALITPAQVGEALDELPDSQLLNIAATIIAGWKPLLITSEFGRAAAPDVDVLIDILRDRAAQFRAVEDDADKRFPNTPRDLIDHLYPGK